MMRNANGQDTGREDTGRQDTGRQDTDGQGANGTALVLGATGGIGGEVTRSLQARGWAVRALHRDPARVAARGGGIRWIAGDAMNARDVAAAADGTQLIVHAVNPPGYRRWGELVLPMIDNTIAAAASSGARILLPGTVYNYGRDVMPLIGEGAPQNPFTVKGRIRAEMERRLKRAADAGGKVLIVRAGDYFGPGARNNWFSQVLAKAGEPLRRITYPGRPGTGHQWAFLPDVAETMARLVEREDALDAFASFHMAGHWDPDGTAMIAAIRRAAGRPDLPVSSLPWRLMALASPFVPLFRELREMSYLWREPVRLDGARLAALGIEAHTPLDAAVRETLAGGGFIADGLAGGAAPSPVAGSVRTGQA